MNDFSWQYRCYLRWVMPCMLVLGQAWFKRNLTYRKWALKALWGAALVSLFSTVWIGVDMPVGVTGAVYWTVGMLCSLLLLGAWFFFHSRVCTLVGMAANDVGGVCIRQLEWQAQSWRLTGWDLLWLRCMPTPEQRVHARAVRLGAGLPSAAAPASSQRPRF